MASLKNVVLQRKDVKTAGGDFPVGPLTASDILAIYVAYRSDLESMFAKFKGGQDADSLFVDLLTTFPEIGAEIVARGAAQGSEEEFDEAFMSQARRLDFGAQFMALEIVGELTVSSAGGLGNLAILVERLAGKLNATMTQEELTSLSGSQTSGVSAPSS